MKSLDFKHLRFLPSHSRSISPRFSVTSERHVPILEVKKNNLATFFESKRKQGYLLIGIEQTNESKPLHKFTFPEKCVLVLGREKTGIPTEIISQLDVCLEIPQFGVIRSLNVHVCASLVIWEYTRQRMVDETKKKSGLAS